MSKTITRYKIRKIEEYLFKKGGKMNLSPLRQLKASSESFSEQFAHIIEQQYELYSTFPDFCEVDKLIEEKRSGLEMKFPRIRFSEN